MAPKEIITNIVGVGIICRAENPSEIFLEIKGDGYLVIAYRRHLCLIGGNWVGEVACNDENPTQTFLREFQEEISFDTAEDDPQERFALFGVTEKIRVGHDDPAPAPTKEDRNSLEHLKYQVRKNTIAYRDYLHIMPQEVIRRSDPSYARGDSKAIFSINLVWLDEKTWRILTGLQEKFKNLSNESLTCILSLDLIIEKNLKCMAGYDRVLQQFWRKCGFAKASDVPLDFEGVIMEERGIPLSSYDGYLERYEVVKKPVHLR
ncbi:MAG: hypothetical protein G01um101470_323 [Parcubacteria group bacterium Gr01-1014_70]|nr:MAG: hypothetical protein G01um101470_323 [Parcubacteria group bacterium Gr01-1014_70]